MSRVGFDRHTKGKFFRLQPSCFSKSIKYIFLSYFYAKCHIFYRLIFLLMAFICCPPEERSDVRISSFVFSRDSQITNQVFLLSTFFTLLLSFPLAFRSIPLLPCYSFHLGSYLAIRSILTPTSPFFYTSPTLFYVALFFVKTLDIIF